MNSKDQDHSLTLVRGHSDSTFYLETGGPIEAKHVEPPWDEGMKDCLNGPGHMTSMAARPMYGKNIKTILLLWNQTANDLESWYAASGTQVLPNNDPGLTLSYFTAMSNLVYMFLYGGKGKAMDFFRNYCRLWYHTW